MATTSDDEADPDQNGVDVEATREAGEDAGDHPVAGVAPKRRWVGDCVHADQAEW